MAKNYRAKNGIDWNELICDLEESGTNFKYYFEEVPELPKVDVENIKTAFEYQIQLFSAYKRIVKLNEVNAPSLECCISEKDRIKSVEQFNRECSQLFGFELVEAKKWQRIISLKKATK